MVHIPKWQVVLILAVLAIGAAFAAPNLLKRETAEGLPGWVPHLQVNLGLDLQGGSYLLLEVDLEFVVREQLENLVDGLRIGLRKARVGYTDLGLDGNTAVFRVRDSEAVERTRQIVRDLATDLLIEVSEDGAFRISFTPQALDERGRNVLDGGAHFHGVYETRDAKHVAIAAIEPKFHAELLERIGLGDDDLPEQWDEAAWPGMRARFAAIFERRTRDEWRQRLEGTDACFAPVLSLGEAARHPHMAARATFVEHGGILQPASSMAGFSSPRPRPGSAAPRPTSGRRPRRRANTPMKRLAIGDFRRRGSPGCAPPAPSVATTTIDARDYRRFFRIREMYSTRYLVVSTM